MWGVAKLMEVLKELVTHGTESHTFLHTYTHMNTHVRDRHTNARHDRSTNTHTHVQAKALG